MQYMRLEQSLNELKAENEKLKTSEQMLIKKLESYDSSPEKGLEERFLVPQNDKYNLPQSQVSPKTSSGMMTGEKQQESGEKA